MTLRTKRLTPIRTSWNKYRPKNHIDDLKRRCDEAGRDWAAIDICFSNLVGGRPGYDDFEPGAYLDGLGRLAEAGVTWVQVAVPGDSLSHTVEALGHFGESVISTL